MTRLTPASDEKRPRCCKARQPLQPGPARFLLSRLSSVWSFLGPRLLIRSYSSRSSLFRSLPEPPHARGHAGGHQEPEGGSQRFGVAATRDRQKPPPAVALDSLSGSTAA